MKERTMKTTIRQAITVTIGSMELTSNKSTITRGAILIIVTSQLAPRQPKLIVEVQKTGMARHSFLIVTMKSRTRRCSRLREPSEINMMRRLIWKMRRPRESMRRMPEISLIITSKTITIRKTSKQKKIASSTKTMTLKESHRVILLPKRIQQARKNKLPIKQIKPIINQM